MAYSGNGKEQGVWSPGRAFATGAVLGGLGGVVLGWLRYGAFEVAHFSSHVLGGLFITGFVLMALAVLHNWYRRNPF